MQTEKKSIKAKDTVTVIPKLLLNDCRLHNMESSHVRPAELPSQHKRVTPAPGARTSNPLPRYAAAVTLQNITCFSHISLTCQYVPVWAKHNLWGTGMLSSSCLERNRLRWQNFCEVALVQLMPEQNGGLNVTKPPHRTETENRKVLLGLSAEPLLQCVPRQQLNYNKWSQMQFTDIVSQERARNGGLRRHNQPPLTSLTKRRMPKPNAACWISFVISHNRLLLFEEDAYVDVAGTPISAAEIPGVLRASAYIFCGCATAEYLQTRFKPSVTITDAHFCRD